ncbi:MAG: O-methyltransferase [Clostridia bacterium]|nr:O-methyltransferase [Clostridia bacterium]
MRHGILKELEDYAEKHSIPIVQPETAKLLEVLTATKKPQRILEVGCAIGYSAILMAQYLEKGGSITTLEWDADMAEIARDNIEKAGLSDSIKVIQNDAKEVVKTLTGEYDIIFLDGPKAHYIYMLNDCIRLLKKGGMLISDNVLYKGMTADDEHVIRRKITIVKRLRRFISAQMQRAELETVILPLGDGVTVSVKK